MPYDGTNFQPDLSLDGLIAWLERQDPETEYDWADCSGGCLVGQFLAANGLHMGGKLPNGEWASRHMYVVTNHCVANVKPYTFGAALARAKQLRGA